MVKHGSDRIELTLCIVSLHYANIANNFFIKGLCHTSTSSELFIFIYFIFIV